MRYFKPFNRYAPFNPHLIPVPRDAGEDAGGGLIDLNGLTFERTLRRRRYRHSSTETVF